MRKFLESGLVALAPTVIYWVITYGIMGGAEIFLLQVVFSLLQAITGGIWIAGAWEHLE